MYRQNNSQQHNITTKPGNTKKLLRYQVKVLPEAEASCSKVTQATAIKRNPLLLFSHTFGLNTPFWHCIAAIGV